MASHHQCQCHPYNPHRSSRCGCCCCSSHPSNPSPSPSPSPSEPLLQTILSLLLQSQSSPPTFHPHYLNPKHQTQTPQHQQQQNQSLLLLQSLLRRVSALESSFHQLSLFNTPPPSHSSPSPASSIRDIAACTIQTHFRAFLVRRSHTLRHLKDLATIKSNLASLKSSLSDKTHLDPDALSQKASRLLLKLDSIRSRDSMIREGKRSIHGELVRVLEVVNGLSANMQGGFPRPKKVSFAESRNGLNDGFEMNGSYLKVVENEDCDEKILGKTFHFHGDCNRGNSATFQVQNGDLGIYPFPLKIEEVDDGIRGVFHDQNGNLDVHFPMPWNGEENYTNVRLNRNLGLSAPMPVQMEDRASDLMEKVVRMHGMPWKR